MGGGGGIQPYHRKEEALCELRAEWTKRDVKIPPQSSEWLHVCGQMTLILLDTCTPTVASMPISFLREKVNIVCRGRSSWNNQRRS